MPAEDHSRGERSDYADPPAELLAIRRSIDNIDTAIVHLLAERFKLTGRAGRIKADLDLAVSDHARESEQIEALRAMAGQCGLEPELAEKFIRLLVTEVLRRHRELRK